MEAASYLSIPEFLDMSSIVWNEKHAIENFEKKINPFDNVEINQKLKEIYLSKNFSRLGKSFIKEYLKNYLHSA